METTATCAPDHAGAIAYALSRLRTELPSVATYHNLAHTELDVLPAAVRLARLSGTPEADRHLLEVAAAFHDLGYIRTYLDHEMIGVGIMAEVLPGFGFNQRDIDRIAAMILATRMPQTPLDELAALLTDADLDSLGRDDFLATSTALWQERAALGLMVPWPEWLQAQCRFLKGHRYFTAVATALREEGKQRNIAVLEGLIRDGNAASPEPH
jgi:uncharacterized protein